jgi:hypothetical protein
MIRRAVFTAFLLSALAFPAQAGSAVQRLDIKASVKMLPGGGATLIQAGTFAGTPLGRGNVRVRTAVGQGRGSVVSFTLSNSRGTVSGRGDCAVTFKGSLILYKGVATITRGTGAFRGMHGRGLSVSGRGELSSERFQVNLSGRVSS